MYNVSIISSIHKELGKCNTEELYRIIEKIKPEVIFEELDYPRFYEAYKERQPFSLETDTITIYIQNNIIEHIPVDTYDMPEINREKKVNMEKIIYENNNEYKKILYTQTQLAGRYGFNALNSIQFNELTEMIKTEEELFFKNTDNEEYKKTYKTWIEFNNNREYEMIRNIYNFSKEHKYNKAIFFVGADHINSIRKKIHEYKEEQININWIFIINDLSISY
jgi:pheromone shutdown protein TraB